MKSNQPSTPSRGCPVPFRGKLHVAGALAVCLAAVALGLAVGASGATVYVNHAAIGANNGTSWENAYVDLGPALTAAASNDEVWVAQGIYRPTTGLARTATFLIQHKALDVYGGFAGTETARDQRDWTAHLTVLSGNITGNDTTDERGVVLDWSEIVGTDNSYNVVVIFGLDAVVALDGFTITAGRTDSTDTRGFPFGSGAGLVTYGSQVTLRNMVFRGNIASGLAGGAIYFWNGYGQMSNVVFIGNNASSGGAVYSRDCGMFFRNVLFQDNDGGHGAGLNASGSSNVLVDVQFIHNVATTGGGMYSYGVSALSNVLFAGNTAGSYGGGLWDYGCSTLTDVRFITNSAGQFGGGMATQRITQNASLARVLFLGNVAGLYGGGLYDSVSDTIIKDSTFISNRAAQVGGAICSYSGGMNLINCVIMANQADYYKGASAIYGFNGPVTLTGVTLYGNTGGVLCGYPTETATAKWDVRNSIIWGNSGDIVNGGTSTNMQYCLVQGGCQAGWACTNVFSADPKFVNPVAGDLHLSAASPAIDAGNNLVAGPALPSGDLDGLPRRDDITFVADTGNGDGPVVDLGAYEAQMGPHAITLHAEPPEGGTTTGGGSYDFGQVVTINAIPEAAYQFMNWCEGGQVVALEPEQTFTVIVARTLAAVFDPPETTRCVPTAWYRTQGLGPGTGAGWTVAEWDAFDCDRACSGAPYWETYYADLDPLNPTSRFCITSMSDIDALPAGTPQQVYYGPSSTGRVYTLECCETPACAWSPVAGQVDIPGGAGWLCDSNPTALRLYRVSVDLP